MAKESGITGIKAYSLIAGILYLIFGIVQGLSGFGVDLGLNDLLLLPDDGIGGVVLMIIGLVFLFGFIKMSRNLDEGISFAYVGTALGLIFAVVYTLILIADVFEAVVLVSEDWEEWTLLDSIKPGLYLGIVTLMGSLIWRKQLSFKSIQR